MDPIKDGVNWYVYVNADPVNFVDAWGLLAVGPGDGTAGVPDPWSQSSTGVDMLYSRFNKATEELTVLVFDGNEDGYFTGTVSETTYAAANRVRTPSDRGFVPVKFDTYFMFPVEFPDGTHDLGRSGTSTDKFIGPIYVPTSATRDVPTYERNALGEWVETGEVMEDQGGYLAHSGEGDTTWGCIKMCDSDVAKFATQVDGVLDSGGSATLTVGSWD